MKIKIVILSLLLFVGDYSALFSATNFNPWVDEGIYVSDPGTGQYKAPQQPNAFYRTSGCIIVSSPCWMFIYDSASTFPPSTHAQINYAEATPDPVTGDPEAIQNYSSNPIITGEYYARLFVNAGTFYVFSTTTGAGDYSVNVRTSTDGYSYTLAKANALVYDGKAWDAGEGGGSIGPSQLAVAGIDGGIWYGYCTGLNASGLYTMAQATSTDLVNWSFSANPPMITYQGPSNFNFYSVNGVYYGYTQITDTRYLGSSLNLPSDIMRFSAPGPEGPWRSPWNRDVLPHSFE